VDGLPTQKKIDAFAYNPKNPKTMFVGLGDGIFLSKNEGRQWSLMKKSPKGVRAILLHPKAAEKIFAGTEDGRIFLSTDGGHTWKLQNR
jgi:photosystem II stability/assembly factor-like uncharacterized protein